jgi:hypothetical protein
VVLIAGAIVLVAVAAGKNHSAAVAVFTAVAALAGPLFWSARTTDQPLQGHNPLANQEGRYLPAGFPPDLAQPMLFVMQGPPADPKLIEFLVRNRGDAKWIAATPSGLHAFPITITTDGLPVLAMGGFRGTDPTPSLPQFQSFVASGDVRFILVSPPGVGQLNAVSQWALASCRPVDLTTGRTAEEPGGQAPPTAVGTILLDCEGAA